MIYRWKKNASTQYKIEQRCNKFKALQFAILWFRFQKKFLGFRTKLLYSDLLLHKNGLRFDYGYRIAIISVELLQKKIYILRPCSEGWIGMDVRFGFVHTDILTFSPSFIQSQSHTPTSSDLIFRLIGHKPESY
jgi:hypothetical protein